MPENRIIKYNYNNPKISKAATENIFKYLSAFCDYRFVEDKYAPDIWSAEQGDIPASARVILGRRASTDNTAGDTGNKRIYLAPDPIMRIYEKVAVKIEFGPYAEARHRPNNEIGESLGRIILELFQQLNSAGIVMSPGDNLSLWPGGHKFALALTHDVDIIRRSVRGSIKLLFKRDVPGGFKGLFDSIKALPDRSSNPYNKIREWIEREHKYGIKSTFFIFPGNRKNGNDPKYGLDKLQDFLDYIKQNRYAVSLHTGIECRRGDNIEESLKLFGQAGDFKIAGIRPHYLSASFPEYWRKGAELGLEYSSCLGFDEEIGFYRGIDLPFMPFDVENDVPLEIVEIPIGIMDCGLINDPHEDLEESLDKGKKLIDRVKLAGGILVLDWHQRTMYNADYPGWAGACFELIDYARKEGAYLTTMEDTAGLLKSRMAGR